jgi:hypothetical protein
MHRVAGVFRSPAIVPRLDIHSMVVAELTPAPSN